MPEWHHVPASRVLDLELDLLAPRLRKIIKRKHKKRLHGKTVHLLTV